MQNIVILTGAGLSAESGLGTFRDKDGLWARHKIEDVATPEGFARDPASVHQFYNARRAQARQAKPNAAHKALATLAHTTDINVTVITQNVDGLHEAAGLNDVIHMHGTLDGALCNACGVRWMSPLEMKPTDPCPACNQHQTRPDVVWFGEIPYHMERIYDCLTQADIFAAIGTSGNVYPAAGFVEIATDAGARTVELNLEPSAIASSFDETLIGQATDIVPAWTASLLPPPHISSF